MEHHVALTLRSNNQKVGPIPVTTSSRRTCPTDCPFFDSGCYAKAGFHTRLHWDKVTNGDRGDAYPAFCERVAALPEGTLWRHNVAGDLVPLEEDWHAIDPKRLDWLVKANTGRRGFTYTHYRPEYMANGELIQRANHRGFTINVSTESVHDAIDVMERWGVPAVTVVSSDVVDNFKVDGYQVVICPAVTHDNVNCASCKLCAQSDRKVIVAFPSHGKESKTVDNIIASVA